MTRCMIRTVSIRRSHDDEEYNAMTQNTCIIVYNKNPFINVRNTSHLKWFISIFHVKERESFFIKLTKSNEIWPDTVFIIFLFI